MTEPRPPGRDVGGPVRQNEPPWALPPGAMFPAAEDSTLLIQRITDEAVPGDVREAEAVVHYPADVEPVTGQPYVPDAEPKNAASGMKTASTGGVVRAGAVMAVATLVSRMTGFLSKVVHADRAQGRHRQLRLHHRQHPAEHRLRTADRRRADLGRHSAAVQGPIGSGRRRGLHPTADDDRPGRAARRHRLSPCSPRRC